MSTKQRHFLAPSTTTLLFYRSSKPNIKYKSYDIRKIAANNLGFLSGDVSTDTVGMWKL